MRIKYINKNGVESEGIVRDTVLFPVRLFTTQRDDRDFITTHYLVMCSETQKAELVLPSKVTFIF